jgi:hypothetical protein
MHINEKITCGLYTGSIVTEGNKELDVPFLAVVDPLEYPIIIIDERESFIDQNTYRFRYYLPWDEDLKIEAVDFGGV